uniref:Baculoviral IAP repeat-containing protein 6 n=1 Tax=Bursaphelenchus xylophilus TaxID=6326 RepID=A0A1I7RY28_BURXY
MNPSSAELHTPLIRVRQIAECNYQPQPSTRLLSACGNLGDYIVVEKDGRLSSIKDDYSIKKIIDFQKPVKVAFANGCLILVTADGFCFRSVLVANSSLNELVFGQHNDTIYIEFSKEQAEALLHLEDSVQGGSFLISSFLEDVRRFVDSGDESSVVPIALTKQLFNELEIALTSNEATHSYAFHLLEKMRFFLDPFKPYNVDIPADTFPYSTQQDVCRVSNMTSEAARRLSFYRWPKGECLFAQPKNLANAGFFLRPSAGNLDRVCCFSCEVCLVNWEPQDDPIREHVEHNSKCNFMNGMEKRNITFEETKAMLPFLSWAQIEQSDVKISPEEILRPVEILLDLYATCMAGSLQSRPEEPRKSTGAFDWLNSVNDIANIIDGNQKSESPLCTITSLCTTSSLDENVQITSSDKIIALLCTSVLVDETRLKKSLSNEASVEEVLTLNTINTFCETTRIDEFDYGVEVPRRPFILVHHVVEFPGDAVTEPLTFVYQAAGKSSDDMITDQVEKSADSARPKETEYIPLYYNAKETVAVGIQCIRLPPEFDNTDFKVSTMHFGNDGSKLLVIIDPSSSALTDFSSSILVYTRIPSLYMFRLEPALKFTVKKKVKNAYFLGNDYFGASTTHRDSARSTEPLNETIIIHYADGTLEIMDLDFCQTCKIEADSILDVTTKSSNALMAVTTSGKFVNIDIHTSIPTCHSDFLDELIVALIESSDNGHIDEHLFNRVLTSGGLRLKYDDVIGSINESPASAVNSFGDLRKLFRMIKSQPLCQQSIPISDRNLSAGTAANLQNAVGVSIQTSSEFVEYMPSRNRGSPQNLAVLAATNCQEFSAINKYVYNELFSSNHDATRVWQSKVQKDQQNRTLIMEMTISFGFNLSHLNINVGFCGFVRGSPDIKMTIYIAKSGNSTIVEDLGDVLPSLQTLPGPSSGFSIEHYLDFLCSTKGILESNYTKVIGPIDVADFVDGEGKQSVIQVSVVPLLLAAAAINKKNGSIKEGWLADTYRFYIVFEVNEALTEAQMEFSDMQTNMSQFKDSVVTAGAKRSRNTEVPSGGIIPLPQGRLSISGEKKKQYTKTKFTTRKRNQAMSMVADIVTTNVLDPFYNVLQKKEFVSALEYVSVSAFQYTNSLQRPNYQRCLLFTNSDLHDRLIRILAGVSDILDSEPYYKTVSSQLYAVDLLQFAVSNFRTTGNASAMSRLFKSVVDVMPFIVFNCFVASPRAVAHKTAVFILDIADLTAKLDFNLVEDAFKVFTTSVREILGNKRRFRCAGSMHYLCVLIYSLCKLIISKSMSPDTLKSVQKLQQASSSIVLEVSRMWHSKRAGCIGQPSRVLSLDELYLYDYPSQVAVWAFQPDKLESACASGKGTYGAVFNKNESDRSLVDVRKRIPSSAYKSSFAFGDTAAKTNEAIKIDKSNKYEINTALATMLIFDESKDVEMKWYEHAGISALIANQGVPKTSEKKQISSLGATRRAMYAAGGNVEEGFKQVTSGQSLAKSCNEQPEEKGLADVLSSASSRSLFETLQNHFGKENTSRLEMGSEFFSGLLEAEPLFFEVVNSNQHVRVVDLNANRDVKMNADIKVESSTPLPMDEFSVDPELDDITKGIQTRFDFERKRAFMPSQSKNLKILYGNARSNDKKAEMFKGLAEMYVLGCHNKFVQNIQSSPNVLKNDQGHNKSDVPESVFYDDMNVDVDAEVIPELDAEDEAFSTKGLEMTYDAKKPSSRGNRSVVFRRPPMLLVEFENCHAGQVFQMVLDLHLPTLITDFIIPANEIMSAVSVDGWLDDERRKSRIAYSTEIERRSLVLKNMNSPDLVRYIRLSFTIRDSRKNRTAFMVGNFYGIRFVSPWNIYNHECEDELLDAALKMNCIGLKDVEKATVRLRRRYETLASQAKKLLTQGTPDAMKTYNVAMADRVLFNTFNNILQRSRIDMHPANEVLRQKKDEARTSTDQRMRDWYGCETNFLEFSWSKHSTWDEASSDELKCILHEWMLLSNDIHFLLQTFKKDDLSEFVSSANVPLDLNSAVLLFGCLTCDVDPSIQAQSCAYLFHQGNRMIWWPDFFPAVIKRYFVNGMSEQIEDAFVRLVFLCHHSVQHNDLRIPIMDRLLNYVIELTTISDWTASIDTNQLSWALLLMSNAFDVIVPNTRHLDRWAFLSGHSCINYLPNVQNCEITTNRRYTRKVGTVKDHNYWGSPDMPQSFLQGITSAPMQYTDKYGQIPVIEQPTWVELRRLATDIKNLGKDLDTKLHNNNISPDTYHMLKKEQKQLSQLYHTSQTCLTKGSMNFEGLFEKVFQSGLDKTTESTSQAPLAAQEDTEDDKIKTDQGQHTNDLKQRLLKMRKNLQILLKQIKYSQYSRKKINESGISRSRRFAVRIKLRNDTVVKSIKLLINLFCRKSNILSQGTQLLLFKICSKLSVHGCAIPVSFREIMESMDATKELLASVFENADRNDWLRYAFMSFVLDVVESENAIQSVVSIETTPSTSARNANVSDTEEPIYSPHFEGHIKRRKGDPLDKDGVMEEGGPALSANSSFSIDKIDDGILISKTLVTSGLLDPSSTCGIANEDRDFHPGLCDTRTTIGLNPNFPFAFNLLDNPNVEEVDLLIFMAMIALKPLDLKSTPIWNNYRTWFLRVVAYNVARAHYDRGEPLSDIFRWFDYVVGAEMEAASASSNEATYMKWALLSIMNPKDFIEREFNLSTNKNVIPDQRTPSHTALACAIFYSDFYSMYETSNHPMDVDDEQMFLPLDDRFEGIYNEVVQLMKGSSSLGSFNKDLEDIVRVKTSKETQSSIKKELIQFYDDCETTYLPIDCSEDVLQYVASRRVIPLNHAIFSFSKLRFLQSVLQVRRCLKGTSLQAPNIGDLLKNVSLDSPYVKPVHDVVVNSESGKAVSITQDMSRTLEKYEIETGLHFLNVHLAPFQLGVSLLSYSNVEHHPYTQFWRMEAERKVHLGLSYKRMSPSMSRTVKSSTLYDLSAPLSSGGTCCGWICQAIGELLCGMDVQRANEFEGKTTRLGGGQFLKYLVMFYSDLQGNVFSQKGAGSELTSTQRLFVLSEHAISSLMKFVVDFNYVSIDIWLNLFKILISVDAPPEGKDVAIEGKNYKFTHWIENSVHFERLIYEFFTSSLDRFSMVTRTLPTYGPAACTVFRRFIQIVFTKQPSQVIMDSVLKALSSLFKKSREFGYITMPVDVLMELTNAIDTMEKVCPCDPTVFAEFFTAFVDFTEDFFDEIEKTKAHFPSTDPGISSLQSLPSALLNTVLESTPIPSNMCFSMTLNAKMQRERNSNLMERLRSSGNNSTSSGKSSKNITFVKRADILENTVRDGEVNVGDQFMQCAYSLMRMVGRYVSQYRPQILKTLLHSQSLAIKRLIDTMFMFVSCTTNVDEIAKDSFKIVTLADAVVHLLLVVSETSMEDPECCRQFIRLVIQTLRSRVERRTGFENSSSMLLMDLPVPVLTLLKSLLLGVSRCQIFVDEGGHTFVAEQLQLALESCCHDWPQVKKFSTMTKQLNMLSTHFTGVEPLSSNLPYNHTPAPVDEKILRPTINSQQAKCSDGFGSGPMTESVKEPVKYSLAYPSVNVINPNNQYSSQLFGNRLSISVKASNNHNAQPLPQNVVNFAPTCLLKSETAAVAQLSALTLMSDKRGRVQNFQHKFPPKKHWLDITFVLPYKVVLYEVAIKIPDNMIHSIPSAIQVELCSDPAQCNWQPLSAPVIPNPVNYIRIPTYAYKFPVSAVRLHLKAPTTSSLIAISQIFLLGSISNSAMKTLSESDMFESTVMNHWISLFSRLCARIDVPVRQYAPTLSEALIRVYLCGEHSADIVRQIQDLLLKLDSKNKPGQSNLISSIVIHLTNGGRISQKTYPSVSELLFTSCSISSQIAPSRSQNADINRPVHIIHGLVIARQRQLLQGVETLLKDTLNGCSDAEGSRWIRAEVLNEVAVFIWASACAVWHNISEESVRYDTIAICLEMAPNLLKYVKQ